MGTMIAAWIAAQIHAAHGAYGWVAWVHAPHVSAGIELAGHHLRAWFGLQPAPDREHVWWLR